MSAIGFDQTVPILRIFSVDKAKEFYVDFLGFALDWEHRFADDLPLYMQVSRGALCLHLSEHHGDACRGSTVFARAPWGAQVMEVADPFGNRIRFNEDD
ncbi:MAG: VOC family protein [Rhodospirillaceae bacterium]|nr:VOC family protein [Rhodospirillaceae bacterium]